MGFSLKLIVADVCLIISIILGFYINNNLTMSTGLKALLIVIALILLAISVTINLRETFKKFKQRQQNK